MKVIGQHFTDSGLKQKQIIGLFEDFDKEIQNPTFVYWRQYMSLVQILLRFIRAEREGNWDLHLSSFAAMLPWFAAMTILITQGGGGGGGVSLFDRYEKY